MSVIYFFDCATLLEVCRTFPSVPHFAGMLQFANVALFSTRFALLQVWRIFLSLALFSNCAAQVWHIVSLSGFSKCAAFL